MKASIDEVLDALADPVRRGAVDLLRKRPRRAGDLARALNVTPPAMSRHLRVLRQTGVVEEQREEDDNRVRMYRLRRKPFVALQAWLDQVEAFWSDQLGSFKRHAEKKARRKSR